MQIRLLLRKLERSAEAGGHSMVDVHEKRSARGKRRRLSDDLKSFPWTRRIVFQVKHDDVDKVPQHGANIYTLVSLKGAWYVPK